MQRLKRTALAAALAMGVVLAMAPAAFSAGTGTSTGSNGGRQITVTPANGLSNGELVTVTWSGFPANTVTPTVNIEQCKAAPIVDVSSDCEISTLFTADAGSNGSSATSPDAPVTVAVKTGALAAGFTCDINNPCTMTVRSDFGNADNSLTVAPITFAAAAPTATTTTAAPATTTTVVAPPADVPEARNVILLPLGAVGIFGLGIFGARRRARSHAR